MKGIKIKDGIVVIFLGDIYNILNISRDISLENITKEVYERKEE